MLWNVPASCTSIRGIVYAASSLNCVRYGSSTRQYGLSRVALRQRGADLAVVGQPAARADAALRDDAVAQPRVHADVHALPVLGLRAVVLRRTSGSCPAGA